jgi:hypothetical protein
VVAGAGLLAAAFPGGGRAFEINGVVLNAFGWDGLGDSWTVETLTWIRCLGATDVAISTENSVSPDTDTVYNVKGHTGPNANLIKAIGNARALGLKVSLKPHYTNVQTGNNLQWPTYRPKNFSKFFSSYTANILAHARIAQSAGATRLVLGTEMGGQITGSSHYASWRTLIAQVRAVFKGTLTYASAFSAEWSSPYADEASSVSFFPLLDEVGFNFYPNLTRNRGPTAPQLVRAFTLNDDGVSSLGHLATLAKKYQKPVILTETGFRSTANYWDSGDWSTLYPPDPMAQLRLHTAEQTVLPPYGSSFLKGGFLWYAAPYYRTAENAPLWDTDYIFRGKPTAALIKSIWLAGKGPPADAKGKPLTCPAP